MSRFVIALLLSKLLLLSPVYAQVDQVDSVVQEILSLQGIERTEYIFRSMKLLSTYDSKKAILYGQEVMGNWNHLGVSPKEKYDFYYVLGSSYNAINQADSMIVLLNEIKEINDDDPFRLGIVNLLQAYTTAAYDASLELSKKAYQYFTREGDPYYLAKAAYATSITSFHLGEYEEGVSWTNMALKVLEEADFPTIRADVLRTKGMLLREMGNIDEAGSYYNQALKIHEQLGYKHGIARTSNQIAIMEARLGNYDRAYDLFKTAMKLYKELGNTSYYIQMVNNLGVVHRIRGEYDSAITYFKKVVSVCEKQDDRANLALALSNIGVSLMDLKKHEESIPPLKRSLELYRDLGGKLGISRVLNNLGNSYRLLKEYDLAIQYYEQSLAIKEEMGRKTSMALTVHNIGDLYREKNDIVAAVKYYRRALGLKKELGDKEGLVSTYFGLGKVSRMAGDADKALQYVDSAKFLAKESGLMFRIRDINEFLSGYYAELGEFKKAYEAHVAFKEVYDSLFTTESESVIAALQQEFKTKEQQQKIELLERTRKNQNQLVAGLVGGAVLLIVLVGVTYNRYRIKNKANKVIKEKSEALEHSNRELKALSEFKQGMTNMIAHDIKNPLNAIIGLSRKLNRKEGADISKAGEAILRLVTNMLDVDKFEETKPALNLKQVLLSDLVSEARLAIEPLLHDKSVRLLIDIENDVVISVDEDLMTRVLVNLLSNAIKFSPSNDVVSIYSRLLELESEKYVKIGISDNGPGISEEDQPFVFERFYQSDAKKSGLTPSTGLGLAFCKMAVMAHDGSISVESEKPHGATFWVTLEVKEAMDTSVHSGDKQLIVNISESDQKMLMNYSSKLKGLRVHNVSAIATILDEIEVLNLDTSWPEHLRNAVRYSNEDQFKNLIDMIT